MSKIKYTEVDDFLRKEDRYKILERAGTIYNVEWKEIQPDSKHNWLTEGMQDDWESFPELGSKDSKANLSDSIFHTYGRGVATCRDAWCYNSDKRKLSGKIIEFVDSYKEHLIKWQVSGNIIDIDQFVSYSDTRINWSESLKIYLKTNKKFEYDPNHIRLSVYRPYFKQFLYFDKHLNERRYQFPKIFPTPESENENRVIIVPSLGSSQIAFHISRCIVDLNYFAGSTPVQCLPFYSYDEDGSNCRENITDWALKQYREQYKDDSISKWDIFYYIYGVLHKPEYRTKYAANLRRSLPRIPFYDDFRKYSEAGKALAELHLNYEQLPEYPLVKIEAKDKQLDWKVVKIKLSKDKQTIIYNDFLSLTGIPIDAFEYKLGNRSALDWIIDQYQISTDKRSGITNDPNRTDDPDYIIRLIGKIVTVSLETVKIVKTL